MCLKNFYTSRVMVGVSSTLNEVHPLNWKLLLKHSPRKKHGKILVVHLTRFFIIFLMYLVEEKILSNFFSCKCFTKKA